MARVLSSLGETSAKHGVQDGFVRVHALAVSIRDRWELDPLENVSKGTSLTGGAPASDNDVFGGLLFLLWEGNSLDKVVIYEWVGGVEVEEGDVVGEGEGVVVLVNNNSDDVLGLLVGAGNKTTVFSSNYADVGGSISVNAVSCRERRKRVINICA